MRVSLFLAILALNSENFLIQKFLRFWKSPLSLLIFGLGWSSFLINQFLIKTKRVLVSLDAELVVFQLIIFETAGDVTTLSFEHTKPISRDEVAIFKCKWCTRDFY